jgi:hypothetical protein
VGLEQGPLSLVSTTEELLDRKVAAPVFENREYGRRDPSRWLRGTLYPQKSATTSPRSGGRSVGIVGSRTQIMELKKKVDRLCGLVVRVPGYITEMCCVSCEVRTEFIYVMYKKLTASVV